ncbi:class II 3-deoxy-7-phosphoheptulonate synthase [Pseudobacteriovorax antillogorgiicola]|uniref:Phospho-2-dehydro-3-deoxyheptonate aldolase n=1 Tax=Pseudobacteriovorax antillogorgiicola TaxID=1513793 RepID=A0A1Y6BZ58_9BACT|nr:3-deoxy-7-phosphoheptulonate synthase class II [Pseudobacteriovorax antillogorgiicola]TCS52456.1 3-deoxy-D-arabinoheptulosonate-7-phosphate synthase [Pseudobacteriovorax antillogorgiicola]SMF28452.1 3-deoxy-D-arabinoheptulosonate-7-phosphate synthase [Pseudobacteriovorax antillogorgiicola]
MNQIPWTLDSWRSKPIKQQPNYDSQDELNEVLGQIKSLPPLVFVGEIEALKNNMAQAGRGECFILQGGDCAERFQDCNELSITAKLKILLQMSVVLCYGAKKPIVRIGRIAGQYAKPRSNPTEVVDGKEVPVYRGDIINSFEAHGDARKPDPSRILQAFYRSTATLNYIRALTKGGFADLHHPQNWDLDFVNKAPKRQEYEQIVSSIQDAITFMESLGAKEDKLHSVEFYTSHEGLLLPMEEALTQYVEEYNGWYNLGAHMLWIGDRTRQLDGAHIEYFRGIRNPVGLKVGPSADPREIIQIVQALNPSNEEGKVTLITRYGEGKVQEHLPKMIDAITESKLNVLWSADPMHGNASKTDDGVKTRNFDSILSEVNDSFEVHSGKPSNLAGIHFELTGEDVTECIGGTAGIGVKDLDQKYETYCDPRLNYSQSLEMAFLISKMLGKGKTP